MDKIKYDVVFKDGTMLSVDDHGRFSDNGVDFCDLYILRVDSCTYFKALKKSVTKKVFKRWNIVTVLASDVDYIQFVRNGHR